VKGKLTTIKRSDGASQVALGGKALYRFAGDKKDGDANGDGINAFGGIWTTVNKPAGAKPSRSSGY
jgi:predicted lipoprotein with Yx(FWY)xxD motif